MTDLYILGSGILGALQFSRETIQALQACRVVFVLHDDLMVHDYIRTLCGDVRDVADLYEKGAIRAEIYRRIADLIVEEACVEPIVGFVVHGHPLFLVSAAEYTLALGRGRGLTVRVLPAISSFDTVLADLEIDYGYALQLFDATELIRSGIQPNPAIPMLVLQLATVLRDDVVFDEPDLAATMQPLVDHLLQTYPGSHGCRIVCSAAHLLERPAIFDVPLAELVRDPRIELWRRPTLYVPALQ